MSSEKSDNITARTARGMAWAYGSYVGGRMLVLVSTAILARILTPADFGVVALALTFMAFLDMLAELGLAEALVIIDEEDVERKADTAWTVMALIGVLLVAASAGLGQLAAAIYDEPQLKGILPVLGATFMFRGFFSTHYALAQKRMNFRARTIAEGSDVVVRAAVGISLAFAGAGVWSLVMGYVAGSIAMGIALWLLVAYRPRPRVRWDDLRPMLAFGGALTAVGLVAAIDLNVDKLLIGGTLGSESLGLYSLASRLPELLLINLTVVAGQVLFPAFASVDREVLARGFLRSLRYALVLVLPLGAFLAVLAEPLLVGVFGDQWEGGATAMQLFTLMAVLSPITLVCGTIWKAVGRSGMLLRLALTEMVTLIPAVILFVDNGIAAVAACQAGSTIVVVFFTLPGVMRMLSVRARELVPVFAPPLAAAAAMAAVLLGVDAVVSDPWPTIIIGAVLAAPVYAGVMWLLARGTVHELLALALPRLRSTEPPEPEDEGTPTASFVTSTTTTTVP